MTSIEQARREFDPAGVYLNTATFGLPPRASWNALQSALIAWRSGTVSAADYDEPLGRARAAYGELVGVEPGLIAVGSQVSVFAGMIAASLPTDCDILVAEGEFTSLTFPFFALGHQVREVPLEQLADEVRPETALVAVSAVQSSDGRVADLAALRATGVRVLLDTTQAAGWLPIDASQYTFTVAGGYKWMLAPRGTAFFTVQPEYLDTLTPINANWYAGPSPWTSIYGSPLRLAEDARRFNVSPAWHSWVAAAPALELLREVGVDAIHAHNLGLAADFRSAVGLAPYESAIVSAEADEKVPALMEQAGIVAAVRAGRLRMAFHLTTTAEDVARAAEVLVGHLR
ncbi:aminotransferase class V-fold PLP-dependent enzyme [Streptomyces sp. SID13031]|uniref:aminotransferase class V-fold PLP-dependent enzyme n=1 Tax=Streptomyces sp. SID13031 TaxID=2706046 RepID=UPI0013CA6044|nr:aminotransferase class V-fold PLP-dependent enzyme [Streptomyces sp. SID13031]NEA34129.1 aminotransferase class V-fold PLP-dependent enzyme [Streptomyces sp. SID13031]